MAADKTNLWHRVIVSALMVILICGTCGGRTFTVNDNGPADFNSIQKAIDAAADGDTIRVQPGTYYENVYFYGKAVVLVGSEPNDPNVVAQTIINGKAVDSVITLAWGEGADSVIDGFTITNGQAEYGGGILCWGEVSPTIRNCRIAANRAVIGGGVACGGGATPCVVSCVISGNTAVRGGGVSDCFGEIRGCLITGNSASEDGGGLSNCVGGISNCIISGNVAGRNGGGVDWSGSSNGITDLCTIVGNRAKVGGGVYFSGNSGDVHIKNTVICNNKDFGIYWKFTSAKKLSYNDLWGNVPDNYGGWAIRGEGDISVDPCFAATGYWSDPHNTPADANDDVWLDGDYHAKSQIGRWDPNLGSWIIDDVTSLCIDAGDPCDPTGQEPYPNGDRIDMGTYGGTVDASKSPRGQQVHCAEPLPEDINGDCNVDFEDLILFCGQWLDVRDLEEGPLEQKWVVQYEGLPACHHAVPTDIAVDGEGNVCVTGFSSECVDDAFDYVTVKYDPNGNEIWARHRRDGPAEQSTDKAYAIAIDSKNNICVTGESNGDYLTVKYDPDGKCLWEVRYDGPQSRSDRAVDVALDGSDDVYVTGWSTNQYVREWEPGRIWLWLNKDYVTVKYDPNGKEQWVSRYHHSGDADSEPIVIDVDSMGDIYMVGNASNGFWRPVDQYCVIRYDLNGKELWVAWSENLQEAPAIAAAVDSLGNICVAAQTWGIDTGTDYQVVKYSRNGDRLWAATYNNNAADYYDLPSGIAIDQSDNIYVTGKSWEMYYDYATVKYAPDGKEVWVARYNGADNGDDSAVAVVIDSSGNINVTGSSSGFDPNQGNWEQDYVTIQYASDGNELGLYRYPGSGSENAPIAIAADRLRNVFVTGTSGCPDSGPCVDCTTIKYSVGYVCTAEVLGDINKDCKIDLTDLAAMASRWLECNIEPPEACWQ